MKRFDEDYYSLILRHRMERQEIKEQQIKGQQKVRVWADMVWASNGDIRDWLVWLW